VTQPRDTPEETVQRGQELYERDICHKVEAENRGKFILIDVETGEYQIGTDYLALSRQFLAQKPDAALCVLRIGYSAVGRIGGRLKTTAL
jgi:hypothetical protein